MKRKQFVVILGFLALGSAYQTAHSIDPPSIADAPLRPLSVRYLSYSPDGKILVAAVGRRDQPGSVIAWDTETRKQLWKYQEKGPFSSPSFAPDGKSLAVAHNKQTALRLDSATGRVLDEIGPHPVVVRAVAYIPGANFFATASDGVIRLWDLKTGKVGQELKGHPAEVNSLVVSPDGKWLVSTGPDTSRIWDLAAGAELKNLLNQRQGIGYYGITFVAPNRVLMSNNGGVQMITELPSGKEVLRFKNEGGYQESAYSASLGLAAFHWLNDSTVWLTDLTFREPTSVEKEQIAKLIKDFDDDSYEVRTAASTAMRKLGSVTETALRKAMTDGPSAEVRMRARETRKAILDEPIRRIVGHKGSVGPMSFSPDGKVLATGADDGTVRLWNPQTAQELVQLDVARP
jgi:WD40 repeat protein